MVSIEEAQRTIIKEVKFILLDRCFEMGSF
jgi:hypothetical protein